MAVRLYFFVLIFLLLPCVVSAEDPQALELARRSYDLFRSGKLAEAAQEMQSAIALDPRNPLYHSGLAAILSREGAFDQAEIEYKKALAISPENEAIRLHLAQDQEQAGDLEGARATLLSASDAPKLNRELEKVDLELGAVIAREGRFRQGLSFARAAANRFPDSSQVWQMRGFFETKCQENEAAVASYTRALKLNPRDEGAVLGLAEAQSGAGMDVAARKSLEDAIKRSPKNALYYQALGVVSVKAANHSSGDLTDAEQLFETALKLDDTLGESHFELGKFALQRGDMKAAEDHLEKAQRLRPNDSRIHFALARLYRQMNRESDARQEQAAYLQCKAREDEHAGKTETIQP